MAAPGVEIRISPEDVKASDYLDRLSRGDLELDELMDTFAGILESSTLERFETNIAPDGTPWEESQRVKEAQGNAKTLLDTGVHLRDTITSDSGSDYAVVGSNSPIIAIHHFGGQAGRNRSVTLPSRKILGISAVDDRDLNEAAADHIARLHAA